jgi:hypothetical protein
MAKRLRRRFAQMEQSVSELKRRIAPIEKDYAWDHAVAVAAIVLSGQPKIDEPLQRAWRRTLRSYEITLKDPDSWHDQVIAARQLVHLIMDKANESAQFTQIFRDAPVWLLQFTGTAMDARLLKFELPDLSRRFIWRSAGYQDARRWPALPLGRMADGETIPRTDPRRLWISLACRLTIGEFPDEMEFFQEEQRFTDPLLDDIVFALRLDDRVPEEELSRYERRRLATLLERIYRL